MSRGGGCPTAGGGLILTTLLFVPGVGVRVNIPTEPRGGDYNRS